MGECREPRCCAHRSFENLLRNSEFLGYVPNLQTAETIGEKVKVLRMLSGIDKRTYRASLALILALWLGGSKGRGTQLLVMSQS